MARYEVRLKRQLRVDTQTLEAGTLVATVECDLPLRMAVSLILGRGIVIGEQQVDVTELGSSPAKPTAAESRTPPADKPVVAPAVQEDVTTVTELSAIEGITAPMLKAFASQDITTVAGAREYFAKHGSFAPLPHLGEKRSADVAKLLGLG